MAVISDEFHLRAFPFIGFIIQKFIIWSSVSISFGILRYFGKGVFFSPFPSGWQVAQAIPEVPSFVSFQSFSPISRSFALSVMLVFLIGFGFIAHGLAAHGFLTHGFFIAQGFLPQGFFSPA